MSNRGNDRRKEDRRQDNITVETERRKQEERREENERRVEKDRRHN